MDSSQFYVQYSNLKPKAMNIEGEDPLISLVLLGQKFWLLDMLFIYVCVLILTNRRPPPPLYMESLKQDCQKYRDIIFIDYFNSIICKRCYKYCMR